jgi:hypothetical protein
MLLLHLMGMNKILQLVNDSGESIFVLISKSNFHWWKIIERLKISYVLAAYPHLTRRVVSGFRITKGNVPADGN